jgi:hypothetical protein
VAALPAAAYAAPVDARFYGFFAMDGRITVARNVRGEHRGQRVRRTWAFVSTCATGPCPGPTLYRERDARRVDRIRLRRHSTGAYGGRWRFWIPLRCGRRTVRHGGQGLGLVTIRVLRTTTVQTTPFATVLSATYTNPSRVNRTRCPGGLGRDAATYRGNLAVPLPTPPTAGFGFTPNAATGDVAFADHSAPGRGGARIRAYRWDFGDPSSGAADTSVATAPTHHYAQHGVYVVTLTVRDANGLTGTVSQNVPV